MPTSDDPRRGRAALTGAGHVGLSVRHGEALALAVGREAAQLLSGAGVPGALGHALPQELVAAGAHAVAGALDAVPGRVRAEDGAAVGLAAALGPLACGMGIRGAGGGRALS
jgi:hypothetical protein